MKLVLTNDDGIDADGIRVLRNLCAPLGEVVVVAPSEPQSGVGHAVTTDRPLRVEERGANSFAVHGTPADCTRVALSTLAPDADWVVSGINHGANLGSDTYISGTVAAAREAAILGRRALAISQYVGKHRTLEWPRAERRARQILEALLARGVDDGHFWNVNLPHPSDDGVEHDIVYCPLDPSPHAIAYDRREGHLHWRVDYHARPRESGGDVDVCFGGRIAVTSLPLRLAPPAPPSPPAPGRSGG